MLFDILFTVGIVMSLVVLGAVVIYLILAILYLAFVALKATVDMINDIFN